MIMLPGLGLICFGIWLSATQGHKCCGADALGMLSCLVGSAATVVTGTMLAWEALS